MGDCDEAMLGDVCKGGCSRGASKGHVKSLHLFIVYFLR